MGQATHIATKRPSHEEIVLDLIFAMGATAANGQRLSDFFGFLGRMIAGTSTVNLSLKIVKVNLPA
ncbi:MAG: hypothetical protein ACJ8CR_14190 [Roseiflexaceae bacterium]